MKKMITSLLLVSIILLSIQDNRVYAAGTSVFINKYEETIYNYLRNELKLNVAAASGVMANIYHESAFLPDAFNANDTGGTVSYGICQWNSGKYHRYADLIEWCRAKGYKIGKMTVKGKAYDTVSLQGQLAFMRHELDIYSYIGYKTLKYEIVNNAEGASQAAYIWAKNFEGCSSKYYEYRQELAKGEFWTKYIRFEKSRFPFSDVSETAYYRDAVEFVYYSGIMVGKSESTFSPKTNLTRGQAAVVIWRMAGEPAADKTTRKFSDVPDGKYYSEAVNWAAGKGIIKGYSDGTFRPQNNIIRQDFICLLAYYAKYKGDDLKASGTIKCSDMNKVSQYAYENMVWAVKKGLIGATGKINPKDNLLRADAAIIIQRYLDI